MSYKNPELLASSGYTEALIRSTDLGATWTEVLILGTYYYKVGAY